MRMLLILWYEWLLQSTAKYASDSLLGVYWERVSDVGFFTQRSQDLNAGIKVERDTGYDE